MRATHGNALDEIKRLVTSEPVLKYYDPKLEFTLQSDASETGLGAAILQDNQPIAYASRALTDIETRYAQIEKELLSVVFDQQKFHQYTYGRKVYVTSYHKPLESKASTLRTKETPANHPTATKIQYSACMQTWKRNVFCGYFKQSLCRRQRN